MNPGLAANQSWAGPQDVRSLNIFPKPNFRSTSKKVLASGRPELQHAPKPIISGAFRKEFRPQAARSSKSLQRCNLRTISERVPGSPKCFRTIISGPFRNEFRPQACWSFQILKTTFIFKAFRKEFRPQAMDWWRISTGLEAHQSWAGGT